MKLISLSVARMDDLKSADDPPVILAMENDLSSVSRFMRGKYTEGLMFATRELVRKSQVNEKTSTSNEEYVVHCSRTYDGLTGIAVTDDEYPDKSAHGIIQKMLKEFRNKHGDRWHGASRDKSCPLPWMQDALRTYQNPTTATKEDEILAEIDSVKGVLHRTIEEALGRQDQMDVLVSKSNDLSDASKGFYKKSKKVRKCCVIQ